MIGQVGVIGDEANRKPLTPIGTVLSCLSTNNCALMLKDVGDSSKEMGTNLLAVIN